MMWLILQQDAPDDYVVATGVQHSVREFVLAAADALDMPIRFEGSGLEEKGYLAATGKCVVAVDPRYFRPAEVDSLLGDATKARQNLGWVPRITFDQMVHEMVASDLHDAKRDALCREEGFTTFNFHE